MPVQKKTYSDLFREQAPLSLCSTRIVGSISNPDLVHIRFAGPIARTPALKNQKIKGTNILRPEAKVVLDLMTRAFQKSCNFQIPQFDADVEVFCLVLCGYRKNTFDEDNVLTTVRDWLEPKHIRNKDRGWGVAVVPNDRMVNAYAIKKAKGALDAEITEIYLRKLDHVRADRDKFIELVKQMSGEIAQ